MERIHDDHRSARDRQVQRGAVETTDMGQGNADGFDGAWTIFEDVAEIARAPPQVLMGECDALGMSGRSRGVQNCADRVRRQCRHISKRQGRGCSNRATPLVNCHDAWLAGRVGSVVGVDIQGGRALNAVNLSIPADDDIRLAVDQDGG